MVIFKNKFNKNKFQFQSIIKKKKYYIYDLTKYFFNPNKYSFFLERNFRKTKGSEIHSERN